MPFPAQTGPWKGTNQAAAALGKPYNAVSHNTPDFSANATYILHEDGGNGFQLIAEYQHRDFQIDATHNRQNDTFQVRVIFIQ